MRRNWALRARQSAITTPSVGPAAFPSRLRASGRTIVDANGSVMPVMRGFNIHAVPFSQQTFTDIYTEGARFLRIICRWDDFEPTSGAINTTHRDALDATITRARTAGLYCMLDLHLMGGAYPSWATSSAYGEQIYNNQGQFFTQYLANRYGNPTSAQYAVSVIGMGLNELPVDDGTVRNGNGSIPYLEAIQRTFIGWMRTSAPAWIGFVCYGYAAATPLRITGYNSSMTEASATAYNSVGGNVVIDLHDYLQRDTRTVTPYDGRQYNGMLYPTYQGGTEIGTATESYTSTALTKAQQMAYVKPYKDFSVAASIPLMIGEWAWVPVVYGTSTALTGEQAYIDDKQLAWDDSGAAFRLHWNYDVAATSVNNFSARPGGTWLTSVADEMGGPPPPPPAPPPGGSVFVSDTFSGGVDQVIAAHTGGTGATWATGGVDRTGHRVSVAGRVYTARPGGFADDSYSYASGTPATAEYDVAADYYVVSAIAGHIGVVAGMDTVAKTGYILGYNAATGAWSLYKMVAGASTTLGTYSATITTGTSVAAELRRRSTGLTVLIAGTSRITSNDVAITAVGKAGLWSYGTWDSATGVHVDNFVATNV